ncbi:conserved hypothetical protein [Trichinella spiralis]|uniref:hypothetical protein n=1 Tax=Trichinella spiralis TaxID=6334 RepID=UPI0001EFD383|nr:conserved hypothetical protein [Trichinella spiralis]
MDRMVGYCPGQLGSCEMAVGRLLAPTPYGGSSNQCKRSALTGHSDQTRANWAALSAETANLLNRTEICKMNVKIQSVFNITDMCVPANVEFPRILAASIHTTR